MAKITQKYITPILLTLMLLLSIPYAYSPLYNVYYVDAQQNMYYAVNTGGQSYRVFYVDASGNTVFVSAYLWDANNSYIIFQAPITGRIYLRPENYTLSTLNTQSWFNPPQDPTIKINVNITWSGLWGSYSYDFTPTITSNTLTFSYNGTAIKYTRTKSFSWSGTVLSQSISQYTTSYASTSTTYTGSITITPYPTASESKYSAFNSTLNKCYVYYYYVGYYYNLDHKLMTSKESLLFYHASTTYTHQSTTTGTTGSISATTDSTTAYTSGVAYYNYVNYIVRVIVSSTSGTITRQNTYSKTNNIITASNGKQIYVYDTITSLTFTELLAVSSNYSYYLYTQPINVTFNQQSTIDTAIIIPMTTESISTSVKSPNPATYIITLSAWCPSQFINYGASESFLLLAPPSTTTNQLRTKLVYNYPISYSQPSISYQYAAKGDIIALIAVNGSVQIINNKVNIQGTITLSNYVGSSVMLKCDGTYTINNAIHGWINSTIGNYTTIIPQTTTTINGSITIESMLIIYNTILELNYSVSIGDITLEQWTMDKISYTVSGQITGSWAYRMPIYLNLAELPQTLTETGFVFRLVLPVGDWVRAGMVSPAFEDLMLVDAGMRPLLYYIYTVDANYATIYVRYNAPITSHTIIIYVLLKNTQLWNTGVSFSTTATFDMVNPRDFTDDFGYSVCYTYLAYNAFLVTAQSNTYVKVGKTWYDFIAISSNRLYEQHGSTIFYNTTLSNPIGANDEVLVYISPDDWNNVLIWANVTPITSITLSEYYANPAYYIGYKNVRFAAAFRMLMYSYSMGQLTGGLPRPQTTTKTTVSAAPPTIDWFTLFGIIFAMLLLSLVFKFISQGRLTARREEAVKLP